MKMKYILLAFVLLFSLAGYGKKLYVSTQGNDSNNGTIDKPLKTLSKAIELSKGDAAGTTIFLRAGIYNIASTIGLSEEHSGTEGNPFVISSYQNEKVILNGGNALPNHRFSLVKNEAVLNSLPSNARGKVYSANIPDMGYLFPAKEKYNASAMVSWDGFVLNRSRFPNTGYAYISEVIDKGPTTRWLAPGEDPAPYSESNPSGGKFKIRETMNWQQLSKEFNRTFDMQVEGYFDNDWYFQQERVGRILSDGTIQLLRYTRYGVDDDLPLPRRIRFHGSLSLIDEPGEWYFDHTDQRFYIWPITPFSDETPIVVTGDYSLINSDVSVSYVQFKKLIFENFSDHGIRMMHAKYIDVLGCEFRCANGTGVRLHGQNNLIQSCDFHHSARGFVLASDNGNNTKQLIAENNVAINNHLHNLYTRGYGAFSIGGVGTRFAHNLIHDMNGALVYGQNDCIVEMNEFYNMGYEMGDWNPMYRGADYTALGNEIRYNFIHHLMETPKGYPVAGLRNDDGGMGTNSHHNIFYKTGRSAVEFSGSLNNASNNIIMDTGHIWWTVQIPYEKLDESLWDTKGDFMQRRYQEYLDRQEKIQKGEMSVSEKENYLGRAELVYGVKGWETNTIWKEHYPNFAATYQFDDPDRNPWGHCFDSLSNNVVVNVGSFPWHIHGANTIDSYDKMKKWFPKTLVLDEPVEMTYDEIFVDFANQDFTFNPKFTQIKEFVGFDVDDIGLYVDEYRTVMPDKKEYRKAVFDKYDGIRSYGGSFNHDVVNLRYSDPEYLEKVIDLPPPTSSSRLDQENGYSVRYGQKEIILAKKQVSNASVVVHLFTSTGSLLRKIINPSFPLELQNEFTQPGIYIVKIVEGDKIVQEKIRVN